MLQEMKIKNFALIKELHIRFAPGLNILTGETGAGKSIIIDALSSILGEKMTTSFIRTGEDRAIIEGTFLLEPSTKAEALLEEMGVEVEGRIVHIRRELGSDGKGRSFINGVRLPTARLKDVGNFLVDIHGQNEHQAILLPHNHLEIVDLFGQQEGILALRQQVSKLHHRLSELTQVLEDLERSSQDKELRLELLSHAVAELKEANVRPGEEEELRAEARRLAGGERLYSELKQAYNLLEGEVIEGAGILSLLGQTEKSLSNAVEIDESLHSLLIPVQESLYRMEDVLKALRDYLEKVNFSPEHLEEVESRIAHISQLLKKYKVQSSHEMLIYQKKIERELENINLSDEQIQKTRKEQNEVMQEFSKIAGQLSEKRQEVAGVLSAAINQELSDLAMENTRFHVLINRMEDDASPLVVDGKKTRVHHFGIDYVEFYIAAGAREALRPLRKIASGGEMSRIMLSLKKLIIDRVEPQSMVFDEVDSGVGGKVAERIGRKLRSLAKRAQVICITHLPQIAAMADIQFKIAKTEDDDARIITELKRLTSREREEEIARMMAGEKITNLTLEHAREMIALAEKVVE